MSAVPVPGTHLALFPTSVRNVLVVSNRLQDPQRIASRLACMHREEAVRIYLLAVVPAPTGHAMAFLRGIDVRRILREDGLALLHPLRAALDAAGVPYRHEVEVGRWDETIAGFARARGCRSIVIGDGETRPLAAHWILRHDAWRVRTRLVRAGFACETT
jgi:hypothetical protein